MKAKLVAVSICMLLISVSFVSVVGAQENKIKIKEANEILDHSTSKLRVIKNKLIEKLGEERYQKIEGDISDKIDIHFMTISPVDYELPFYEFLKEIAVFIVAIALLILGHNFVGEGLGAVLCVLLLGIPVLLLAIVVTLLDFSEAMSMNGIDFRSLIEDFGVLGTLLICIFLIPCLIVVLCAVFVLVTPIVWIDLMASLIQYAISNA